MASRFFNFTKKEKACIGVDLGARHIKIAILDHASGTKVRQLLLEPIPPKLIVNGTIADAEALSERIRNKLKNLPLRNSSIITGTGPKEVITRIEGLPRNKKEKALTLIPKDDRLQMGNAMDYQFDIVILDEEAASNPTMQAIIVRAKKDAIVRRQQMFYDAMLPASIIDVDSLALVNIYKSCFPTPSDTPTVLMNIGYEYTVIVSLDKGHPVVLRTMTIGTKSLQDRIEKTGLIGAHSIEEEILSSNLASFHATSFKNWIDELTKEITRSTQHNALNRNERLVYITGGGSLLHGVVDALSTSLKEQVKLFNPLDHMALGQGITSDDMEKGPMYSIALGFALRGGI